MHWCVSIGAVLVAGAMAAGDVAGIAAPDSRSHLVDAKDNLPSVDIELVIAVDVSYSMDLDELAVQREGYAQAIISKDFLQAMKTGPHSKVAVTYFEWSAWSDQKIIIPWRLIDGPESADAQAIQKAHENAINARSAPRGRRALAGGRASSDRAGHPRSPRRTLLRTVRSAAAHHRAALIAIA